MLAAAPMLCAHDAHPTISPLEVAGWAGWLICWCLESLADGQKLRFLAASKAANDRTAVLGWPPYADGRFWMWARCRHPNYFFEWCCWLSLVLAALPSLSRLDAPPLPTLGLGVALLMVPLTFYDCLMHWTGAEPAEHFSLTKRPAYALYQRSTRVFWPFELPLVDHGRVAGWPLAKRDENKRM